jgi:hypothetical protein
MDPHKKESLCSPCPANTFNIGGGVRFSGADLDWKSVEQQFSTYCWTSGWLTWHLGMNCTNWEALPDGSGVVSGETTLDAWVESQLVYYDHLVNNGTLTVHYTKDSKTLNGFNNGEFSIYINGDRKHVDNDLGDDLKKIVQLDVEAGKVEIIIVYEKYNSLPAEGDDEAIPEELNAMVNYFELRGTAHSSHTCFPCKQGFSKPGSDSCNLC